MSFTYKALYSKSLTAKRKIFSDGFVRVSCRGNSNAYVTLYAASSSGNSPTGEALDSGYVSTKMLGEEFIIERYAVLALIYGCEINLCMLWFLQVYCDAGR